jgi:hypothetical protein
LEFDGLKLASSKAAELGYFEFDRTVDQMQIGGNLTRLFEKLVADTRGDSKERGRLLRVDLGGNRIYVDPTTVGDKNSVTQSYFSTVYHGGTPYRVFSMVHTHPVDYLHGFHSPVSGKGMHEALKRAAEHLSPQDFLTLLRSPTPASMVLCEGNWLWVLKTRRTPSSSDCSQNRGLKQRLTGTLAYAQHHPNVQQLGDPNRIFAKLVCIDFGLELYIAQPKDRTLFKRVLLTPKLHS